MRKVRNLNGFKLYAQGDQLHAPGTGVRSVSFEVNPVGPCVVYLYTQPEGKKVEPVRVLVGLVEQQETLEVTVEGVGWFQLEPSAEVWVRHKWQKVTNPNPGAGKTFTRMEKMGVEQDEIGTALHRQSVLQKIATGRENYARDAYQRQLEKQIAELGERIALLTPPPGEEVEGDVTQAQ